MATQLFVIWEDIPKNTRIYRFTPDDTRLEDLIQIQKAHSQIGGTGDANEEATGWLFSYLRRHPEQMIYSAEADDKPPIIFDDKDGRVEIVHSGWML